jgi:hypothetical protein
MKIIKTLLLLPLAAGIIVLSVANRQDVVFSLSPLPYELDAPLYLLLLAVFAIGLVVGGSAVGLTGVKRWQRKRVKSRAANQQAPESKLLETVRAQRKFPITLSLKRKQTPMEDE